MKRKGDRLKKFSAFLAAGVLVFGIEEEARAAEAGSVIYAEAEDAEDGITVLPETVPETEGAEDGITVLPETGETENDSAAFVETGILQDSLAAQEDAGAADSPLEDSALIEEETTEAETEAEEILTHYTGSFHSADMAGQGSLPPSGTSSAAYTTSYGIQLQQSGSSFACEIYSQMEQHFITDGRWDSFTVSFSEPYRTQKVDADGHLTAEGEKDIKSLVLAAAAAFDYDTPDYYLYGGYTFSCDCSCSGGLGTVAGLKITPPTSTYASASCRRTYDQNVKAAVSTIRGWLNGATDRYSIALAIHDYMCDLLARRSSAGSRETSTAAGAFLKTDHKASAAGYCKTFKALCDRFALPCVCVSGKAGGASRMWNYVQMEDGKWYLTDVFMDDGDETGYTYFLAGAGSRGTSAAISSERDVPSWWTPSAIFSFSLPPLQPASYQHPALTLTSQPKSQTATAYGQTLVARVGIRGVGLGIEYKWQYRWPGSSVWTTFLSGNGGPSIRVRMSDPVYNGIRLRCIVTDMFDKAVTTSTAVFRVDAPYIAAQPKGKTASAFGKSVTVSLKAKGSGLAYSWQYQFAGSSKWAPFHYGNGKSSISVTMYNAAYQGLRVRCIVKNASGRSVTSRSAVLYANEAPEITRQPSNVVCAGAKMSVSVSLKAAGIRLKYRWQYRFAGSSVWKTFVSGNGKSSLSVWMANASYDRIRLRCIVTDSRGRKATSRTAVVRFGPKLAIKEQPADLQSPAVGTGLTVTLKAVGTGLKYNWQYQWDGTETWRKFISGNGKSSIRVSMQSSRYDKIKVRCIVTDGAGKKVTSRTATLKFSVAG